MEEKNEKNDMVTCSVCKRIFENQFALDGHVRLTMDTEHVAFRQQQSETVSDTSNPVTPVTPRFAGNKTIDVIETWIKNQEQVYGEEAKTNALIMTLKRMVEGEREIEQQYHDFIKSEKEKLSQNQKKIEENVWRQFHQEVEKRVAQEKVEWERNHQEELNVARWERKNDDILIGYNTAAFWIPPTSSNGDYVCVLSGSPLESYLISLIDGAWVSHPEKTRLVFEQQIKFLQEIKVGIGESGIYFLK